VFYGKYMVGCNMDDEGKWCRKDGIWSLVKCNNALHFFIEDRWSMVESEGI
jgi:hypothetical protein